jgi:hypothetical protein
MRGGEFDFTGARPRLAAQPVDDAAVGDRHQKGSERAGGIVGVADGVDGQQHVLHRVFDIAGVAEASRCQRAHIGCDGLEQCAIGGAVAVLRRGHEARPVALAGLLRGAASGGSDEPQRGLAPRHSGGTFAVVCSRHRRQSNDVRLMPHEFPYTTARGAGKIYFCATPVTFRWSLRTSRSLASRLDRRHDLSMPGGADWRGRASEEDSRP